MNRLKVIAGQSRLRSDHRKVQRDVSHLRRCSKAHALFGDRQPALVRRDNFKFILSEGYPDLPATHLRQECWIIHTEITHTAVACTSLTGIYWKGNIPCKIFIPEVGKGMPFLSSWDALGVDFFDIPGCRASRLILHLHPPENLALISRYAFFVPYVRDIAETRSHRRALLPVRVVFFHLARSL